jgi:hypothetical protein
MPLQTIKPLGLNMSSGCKPSLGSPGGRPMVPGAYYDRRRPEQTALCRLAQQHAEGLLRRHPDRYGC